MAPSVVSGSRPSLNAGGSHLAMTEDPAKRLLQATGIPFASRPADNRLQTGSCSAENRSHLDSLNAGGAEILQVDEIFSRRQRRLDGSTFAHQGDHLFHSFEADLA